MEKLKDNLKDLFTDIIGGILIITAIVMYLFFDLTLAKASVTFLVGVAFFFIPDDILSQMAQKVIKKKLGDEDKPKE